MGRHEPAWRVGRRTDRHDRDDLVEPRRQPRRARRSSSTCSATCIPCRSTGGDAKALTDGIAWDFEPRFSPDGRRIAFISDRGGARQPVGHERRRLEAARADRRRRSTSSTTPRGAPTASTSWRRRTSPRRAASRRARSGCIHVGGGGGLPLIERPQRRKGPEDDRRAGLLARRPLRLLQPGRDVRAGSGHTTRTRPGRSSRSSALDRETGEVDTIDRRPRRSDPPRPVARRQAARVRQAHARARRARSTSRTCGRATSCPSTTGSTVTCRRRTAARATRRRSPGRPTAARSSSGPAGKIRRVERETKAARPRSRSASARERKIHAALRFPGRRRARRSRDPDAALGADSRPTARRSCSRRSDACTCSELPSGRAAAADRSRPITSSSTRRSRATAGRSSTRRGTTTSSGAIRVVPRIGGAGRAWSRRSRPLRRAAVLPRRSSIVYRKITGGYLLAATWSLEPGIYVVPVVGGEPSASRAPASRRTSAPRAIACSSRTSGRRDGPAC